jgi:hypothetical protein
LIRPAILSAGDPLRVEFNHERSNGISDQNQAVVRRIIEDYWNKKNLALAGDLFAVDSTLHIPDGHLPKGVPGVAQLYGAYATAFPDFRLTIEDMRLVSEGCTAKD